MIEKLIAELELDLNPNDIKVLCGRIRDEYNPKKGGAWVALRHPALDGDVYVDGDGSTSQLSLLRIALKDLAELVNGEGEWEKEQRMGIKHEFKVGHSGTYR